MLTGHSHSYERSFLLDGHYGPSWTLTAAMKLDPGDGRPGSRTGAYTKENAGPAPHEGAVYAVAGSSSQTSGGPLEPPGDVHFHERAGLDGAGRERQRARRALFWMMRARCATISPSSRVRVASPVGVESDPRIALRLEAMQPNPFRSFLRVTYSIPRPGGVRLTVYDAAGRRVATLVDGTQAPGRHTIGWNGHDQHGREVAPGVYFGRLEFDGTTRQGKIVLTR